MKEGLDSADDWIVENIEANDSLDYYSYIKNQFKIK